MAFSLFACKQFLKDYINDNSDVAFSSEDFDTIASEISRTNMQFTHGKLISLIKKLKIEGRLNKSQEKKMNELALKEHNERVVLYKWYLTSKYAHPLVNYDSLENTNVIWNGYRDPVTNVVFAPGIMDLISYPTLEIRHIVEVVANLASYDRLTLKTPHVVERIVEIERQPTAAEIAKAKKEKFEIAHSQGFNGGAKNNRTELDRDDQFKKPPLREEKRVAINERNNRINEVLSETLSSISNYSAGKNHARTAERKQILRDMVDKFMPQVKDVESAERLARTINEKINSFNGSNSSVR